MIEVILQNMNLMIQKVTFEKPNGWQFKIRNYKKVQDIIKGNEDEIIAKSSSFKQIEDVYTFYDTLFKQNGYKNPVKIMKKIIELYEYYFANTNNANNTNNTNNIILREAQEFKSSPAASATDIFNNIYGIGPAKIRTLISNNIYNIAQLRQALNETPSLLNNKQKIGLKYYEDLVERIPRSEITKFRNKIQTLIEKTYGNDIQMTIAGSYRRGVKSSGDIDMLITSHKYEGKSLKMVLELLEKTNMIHEILAKGLKKFMGIIRVTKSGRARHLDIVETTPADYPFAMLYFTGSAQHNIQMRKHALSLGYSLNEYDMTLKGTKTRVPPDQIQAKIGKPNFETEQDIFQFLKLNYKEPTKRIKFRS
jgi:DNA polymerase/3'-5' exonuclease PolX